MGTKIVVRANPSLRRRHGCRLRRALMLRQPPGCILFIACVVVISVMVHCRLASAAFGRRNRAIQRGFIGGVASGSGDPGYFGGAHLGVYVGVSLNYVAKYSNNGCPLEPNDVVSVIAFRMCPGREYQCRGFLGPVPLMKGFDSHISPERHEWWLPRPHQLRPAYILRVRAFERPKDENCDDGL